MLDTPVISGLVGTVLGFLSGLGTGGGSLLLLWLTAVLEQDPLAARTVNLMFFIPTALAANLVRLKTEHPDYRKILPCAIAGCIAAAVFSLIGQKLETELLKKLFGALLILIGLREIAYRPRKAR